MHQRINIESSYQYSHPHLFLLTHHSFIISRKYYTHIKNGGFINTNTSGSVFLVLSLFSRRRAKHFYAGVRDPVLLDPPLEHTEVTPPHPAPGPAGTAAYTRPDAAPSTTRICLPCAREARLHKGGRWSDPPLLTHAALLQYIRRSAPWRSRGLPSHMTANHDTLM